MDEALKDTYERIGRQVAEGLAAILGALSQNVPAPATASAQVEALRAEVAALQARLDRLESEVLRAGGPAQGAPSAPTGAPEGAAEAAQPRGRAGQAARGGRRAAVRSTRKAQRRRRTPKEEVRQRALAAGRKLAAEGQRVNLKTVADAAGLNYGQVTYAFERKENLLKELGLLDEGQNGQINGPAGR